ncbi:folliculin [Tribolium castaneum]|uniref:Folliculin-like Protein n=1 Tax=Tribolium castaneum TaxID=7070 RepID=D6WDJ6_TRICA|nr:PREDICTED: folliculin [Tribolium castaneum]EEZ99966.1 Folliculin-like Protein [Tribolium castaneum]|eukprot:XP_968197.1 PREDICTED: folliculin [Tribolium castaneum]
MDGVVGLGHFCESHGPCVILATQRCQEEPRQYPHSLSVPWCESCQSIDLDQSLVSKDEGVCYVTTRTPLQQDVAFLLKQAAVRSLSCEETREGGTMYFGDSERGHVLSHTFALQDSLARGFHRKYSILILMRDKIHLLNCWPILTKNIKEIASDLQTKAAQINGVEQSQCSQRAVRQAQGSPSSPARSLSQLTGEPAVFAHLHMWFTWLLTVEPFVEKPSSAPEIPISCPPAALRALLKDMDRETFRKAVYCILTGIKLKVDQEILGVFRQLLPQNWSLPKSGEICKLGKIDDKWVVEWSGCLPPKLPKLQTVIEEALQNEALVDRALEPFLIGAILHWRNVARSLTWVSAPNQELFQSLGVQKFDLPLLAYWTAQCRNEKN